MIVISRADRATGGGAAVFAQARAELAGTGLRGRTGRRRLGGRRAGLGELLRDAGRGPRRPTAAGPAGPAAAVGGPLVQRHRRRDGGHRHPGRRHAWLGDGHADSVLRRRDLRGHGARAAEPWPDASSRWTRSTGSRSICGGSRPTSGPARRRRGDARAPGRPPGCSTCAASAARRLPEAPEHLTLHVGTAAVPARLRPFDDDHAPVDPGPGPAPGGR